MRLVRVLDAAAEEAVEAAAWYERQRPGLGEEFVIAVQAALDLIEAEFPPLLPAPGAAGVRGVRRLIMRRFPFDVVVAEAGSVWIIVAFAHQARKPGYWHDRLRT
jgi:toxin ParE1/3/4